MVVLPVASDVALAVSIESSLPKVTLKFYPLILVVFVYVFLSR